MNINDLEKKQQMKIAGAILNYIVAFIFLLTAFMKLYKNESFAWFNLANKYYRASFFFFFCFMTIIGTSLMI